MEIKSIQSAKILDSNKKSVIITGCTGQDGSHMADYLLKNTDYTIYGAARRLSVSNHENIKHITDARFVLFNMDVTDPHSIGKSIQTIQPSYFINFAAQSFVGSSWDFPEQTWQTNCTAILHMLEAIRQYNPNCRFYNAGCHDTQTKVLTESGLKDYKDVKIGDFVYSINPITKDLELKKILKIFEYDYNGDMFEFKHAHSGKAGLCVTPNHKMLYKTNRNNILFKEAKEFINLSDVKYPRNNPVSGKVLTEITDLKKFIPIQKRKGNKNYGKHIKEIITSDLLYLMGLYIGDGSCRIIKKKAKTSFSLYTRKRDLNGKYTSKILPENEKIEVEYQCPQIVIDIPPTDECFPKLVKVLNRNNIKWKLHGQCDVTFHQWGLIPYFSECGHSSSEKRIPSWIFDLDSSHQMLVLNGIMDSDGQTSRNTIYTCSRGLRDDLIRLNLNCGIITSISEKPPRNAYLKDGGVIKGNFPSYIIHSLKENKGYQRGNFKIINYIGKVWCLEVEDNHNFVVERNGRITFSGNSSEEFGDVVYSPQDENHPPRPRSPYGASKVAARQLVKVYRESFKLYAVQGWLFNHEGTRRGEEFVTRKITKGVVRIKKEIEQGKIVTPMFLGNVDAKRDWGDSEDFVDAVWRMMNQNEYILQRCQETNTASFYCPPFVPKDYVVGTGETHTIKEFVTEAFKCAGIDGYWEIEDRGGSATARFVSRIMSSPIDLVKISPEFYRPADVNNLIANYSSIKNDLGWEPTTTFKGLVQKMVDKDLSCA